MGGISVEQGLGSETIWDGWYCAKRLPSFLRTDQIQLLSSSLLTFQVFVFALNASVALNIHLGPRTCEMRLRRRWTDVHTRRPIC